MPLASNAGWFEGTGLLHSLALRLKTLLLIEDDIIVDPGAFTFSMTRGEISEQFFTPASVPWVRDNPGLVGVVQGGGGVEMRMDWQPLFASSGLTSLEGLRAASRKLSPQTKRKLRADVDAIAGDADIVDTAPGAPAVREMIVKHFLLDAASAVLEGASVAVDGRARGFAKAVNAALVRGNRAPERNAFSFRLHDVREWQWDGVARFRSSSNGKRVRELVDAARKTMIAGGVVDEAALQQELDRQTGRDASGPQVAIEALATPLPSLMSIELLEGAPAIYVVGVD